MKTYVDLHKSGELKARAEKLYKHLSKCQLCPHECDVDRIWGMRGICNAGDELEIARIEPHMGEEPVISGTKGAGTIFFTFCGLQCAFCQNYQISHQGYGKTYTIESLADGMIELQEKGVHNIELVTPTHFLPHILGALDIAAGKGLNIPIVYNTSGYEKVEILKELEGIVSIYLPDAKYGLKEISELYSTSYDYPDVNLGALAEMWKQVGQLECDDEGIAIKGLIIRHLIIPGHIDNTEKVLSDIKDLLGTDVHISLMAQYMPIPRVKGHSVLGVKVSKEEYDAAIRLLEKNGFQNGWRQEYEDLDDNFFPDFRDPEFHFS